MKAEGRRRNAGRRADLVFRRVVVLFFLLPSSFSLLPSVCAEAQEFSSRGFADAHLFLYPQTAPRDPTRVIGDALFRYEPELKLTSWLRVNASFDARMDTHDQVERRWKVDWWDRGLLRPPLSVRRLSAIISRGALTIEVGKQFVRWGKADVLNPTDRFAPRDFLSVVDNEFLGITATRLTYESRGNTLDAVWVPRFTPGRIPLFNERWTVLPGTTLPAAAAGSPPGAIGATLVPGVGPVPIFDGGARYPNGSQAGVRFNRSGAGYEFSVSFYNGFNYLPLIDAMPVQDSPYAGAQGFSPVTSIDLVRVFPPMRMYGGDFAVPRGWVTLKGEFGYFTSTDPAADEYGIYVVQIEKQVRDWLLVGGYAGDFTTKTGVPLTGVAGNFAADRGLAKAFLGRAALTIDATRNLALQAAVRQTGHGTWLKGEYSQGYGAHLRATFEGNWIAGQDTDFIGQFHRNSNVNVALRYSF